MSTAHGTTTVSTLAGPAPLYGEEEKADQQAMRDAVSEGLSMPSHQDFSGLLRESSSLVYSDGNGSGLRLANITLPRMGPMVLFVLALGLLTLAFDESRATSGSGIAHLEMEGTVKVKHQVSNSTTNLQSRVVDDDVPREKDETVSEEIIHMPPKSYHLKLPRAGSKGGESSAMIDSIVCACAKCGSTSFYRSLYKIAFGEDWSYSGKPWIQNLASHRWKGVADEGPDLSDTLQQNSFALIRDPKDRLLSAFRSKVTCGKIYLIGDRNDRKRMVPKLLELAGLLPLERYGLQAPGSEDAGLCLNRTTYLRALSEVWRSGKEAELDAHFLPQTNSCFLNLPPSKWKVVTSIDRPGALCDLESVVRGAVTSRNGTAARDSEDCSFIKRHSTEKGDDATLSEEEEMLLEEITRKEYEVLGPYL